ncbi:MAG: recombination protein RecR [Chlamydiae bacterium]|nr:recombination protein RecR [Chlamydiota bacterium]
MSKYPSTLNTLIALFKKIPGVGFKTAERYAFHLLQWNENQLQEFSRITSLLKIKIQPCAECGCLTEDEECSFCNPSCRDPHTICIISSAKDVYPIEETHVYKGMYHVIGGLLSPLDGKTPQDLQVEKIKLRIEKHGTKDIILALDSTLEGDATALFLREQMQHWGVTISRPAMGMPMGSSLDFVDGGTLAKALLGRQTF